MELKQKNSKVIITALFTTIIQIILVKEIFQMLIASIFGVGNSNFSFSFPFFSFYFEPEPNTAMFMLLLLYFAPYLYLISCIEISSILLKKIPLSAMRYFFVVFILLQLGYILIHIFYSAVILILNPQLENDWIALSLNLGFGDTERFVFAFGVIFLFVFYLNMSTKRIIKYFNY